MRRIVVLGCSGAGKTTFARKLSEQLGVAHIELDALHWEPNWTSTPIERFREKVRSAIATAPRGWVVCGQYSNVRDEVWPQADTVVWLDYPMTTVVNRVVKRTIARCRRGEELWGGCREDWYIQLCTKDSLFLWVFNTWRKNRWKFPHLFRTPAYQHLRVIRFRDPLEADRWLENVCPA
jgi:adenylate kinase family enzyme